jgi:hypothetical protein
MPPAPTEQRHHAVQAYAEALHDYGEALHELLCERGGLTLVEIREAIPLPTEALATCRLMEFMRHSPHMFQQVGGTC